MEAKNNSTYHCNTSCNKREKTCDIIFFLPLQRTGICASINKAAIASARTSLKLPLKLQTITHQCHR